MRVIAASILCAASAFRTNVHVHEVQKQENTAKWGATCDDLQNTFNTRLASIQESVDALDPANPSLSAGAQARLTMRVYGIGRTLRRAKECEWVANAEGTDSDNAVRVQSLVSTLFQMNPCSQQAQAEMEAAGDDEEARAAAMQRTMSILTSDTCEATQVENSRAEMAEMNDSDEEVDDEEIDQEESMVVDAIEQMVNEDGGAGSSFIESKYAIERFVRFLIVLAIYILLVVLCTWVVVWIGLFIISYFTMLLSLLGVYISATWAAAGLLWRDLLMPPAMLACGYDLFLRILNPELHRLQR